MNNRYSSVLLENLKNPENENYVTHTNGSSVTSSEIYSGISFTSLATNSIYVTFSFQSSDKAIVQKVTAELANVSIEKLKEASTDYSKLVVSTPATSAVKNSKEKRYFLIALAVDAVLALGVPFIYEIFADEVYDKEDVTYLGSDSFELKVSKK